MLRNKDFILETSVVDRLVPYVFDSAVGNGGTRTMGKIWFCIAIFFALIDLYSLMRHGHIVGAVFVGLLFGLVGGALYTIKGTTTISNQVYRSEYQIYGLPYVQETPIKGWQILHVNYNTAPGRTASDYANPMYIQFYLAARDDGRPTEGFCLFVDVSFELDADPAEVAAVIKKLKDATGFKLTFGKGPMRDIYPTYKKLYGELND